MVIQSNLNRNIKLSKDGYELTTHTEYKWWNDVQRVIDTFLKDRHTDGDFLWSKASNGYVAAGATYDTYTYGGNTIGFKLDASLDVEFPDRKYAIMVDLTPDTKTGKSALNMCQGPRVVRHVK